VYDRFSIWNCCPTARDVDGMSRRERRPSPKLHPDLCAVVDADRIEDLIRAPDIHIVAATEPRREVRPASLACRKGDDPVRFGESQGFQQNAVHDTEDGGAGSNAKCESQPAKQSKAGVSAEPA
jgi:hypothetical protein